MKIVTQSFKILNEINKELICKHIEDCGRVCYKSENKSKDGSYSNFIRTIIKSGHESVIEHFSISVKFICDRGVSHELVRHRIASFSQESTRYCNYSADRFNNEILVVKPDELKEGTEEYNLWFNSIKCAEHNYMNLINKGISPQIARSVLPNALKTEIVVTANLREWRHILKLRTSKAAHPQIREIMIPLLEEFNKSLPDIFFDIYENFTIEKEKE